MGDYTYLNFHVSEPSYYLSRCLIPSHKSILLAELLHLNSVIGQYIVALVTFVSQKYSGYGFPISKCQFGIQVFFPFGDGLKGGRPCHIEHNEGAHGLTVVHAGHVAKPFLTCNTANGAYTSKKFN